MQHLRAFPRFAIFAALLFIHLHTVRAQSGVNPPAVDAAQQTVVPTVTVEMGDTGGKYFGKEPDPAKTRHYYIAAEPVLWNFAPEGLDPVCGKRLPDQILLYRHSWKIRYVQYADPEFKARVLPTERLGIMGPVLRGVTGEYIAVTFLNRSWMPLSMHPHGLRYDKDSEGSMDKDAPGKGAAVAPGAKFTYVWHMDEASGPRPEEPSSKAWLYHSHANGDEEINMGLMGFIVVTDPKRARPDGTPKDVDREMAALFLIFNEAGANGVAVEDADDRPPDAAPTAAPPPTWADLQQANEEGQRHTINGLTFGNLKGLDLNEGEHVRWYLFGLGSESDFHTAHWHGLRVIEDGSKGRDVIELLPASMKTADMVADNPGSWLFHCHVAEHMKEGMYTRVVVHGAGEPAVSRDSEVAFFGMPQSLQTLRFQKAEFSTDATGGELYLDGEVTAPDPYLAALTPVTLEIGDNKIELKPNANGIAVTRDVTFLIKNTSLVGNGAVTGGKIKFELSLRGAKWIDALKDARILSDKTVNPDAHLKVVLTVGTTRHSASVPVKASLP